MKKVLLIGFLFSTSLFADRYMMLLEYQFINGCTEGNESNLNKCICMLTEIQKTTSQSEMIDFGLKVTSGEDLSDELSGKMLSATLKCNNRK